MSSGERFIIVKLHIPAHRLGLLGFVASLALVASVPAYASDDDDMRFYFESMMREVNAATAIVESAKTLTTIEAQCARIRQAKTRIDGAWHVGNQLTNVTGYYRSSNLEKFNYGFDALNALSEGVNNGLKEQCAPLGL